MRIASASWRALRVVLLLVLGAAITLAYAMPDMLRRRPGTSPPATVQWWFRALCRILALDIEVVGRPAGATLMVANHVSWLDIPVLASTAPMVFLSKAEVGTWPLIGWMSNRCGTLYIQRGGHQTATVADVIANRIRDGLGVVVFPEGTTGDGRALRRFHPRLFAVAGQAGVQVQPVALRYGRGPEPDPIAPFIGDDSLVPHLWRVLRQRRMAVRVQFLPPFSGAALDRRQLAARSRAAIAAALGIDDAAIASDRGPADRSGPARPAS